MKEFNDPVISDLELRHMLQLHMLMKPDGDSINDKLIHMEAINVFSNTAMFTAVIPGEDMMMNKLKTSLGKGFHLKWLFSGLIVSTAIVFYTMNRHSDGALQVQTNAHTTVQNIEVDQVAEPQPKQTESALKEVPLFSENLPTPNFTEFTVAFESQITDDTIPPPLKPISPIEIKDQMINYQGSFESKGKSIIVDTIFKGIVKLEVKGLFCDINVKAVNDDKIKFNANLLFDYKNSKHQPNYRIRYERINQQLTIWVENIEKHRPLIRSWNTKLEGKLNFEVPESILVNLQNTLGNMSIQGLKAEECVAECLNGNMVIENVEAGLNLISRSGNIDLKNIKGNITCESNYGHLNLSNIEGTNLLKSISGNIKTGNSNGYTSIESKYGHVHIDKHIGTLELTANCGDVTINQISGSSCRVKDLYGHIRVNNALCPIYLESGSGNISLNEIKGDLDLVSKYGHQTLNNIQGNIRSNSSSGDISILKSMGDLNLNSSYGNIILNECKGKIFVSAKSGNISGNKVELVESMDLSSLYGNIQMNILNKSETLSFELQTDYGSSRISMGDIQLSKNEGILSLKKGEILLKSYARSGTQLFN